MSSHYSYFSSKITPEKDSFFGYLSYSTTTTIILKEMAHHNEFSTKTKVERYLANFSLCSYSQYNSVLVAANIIILN